MGRQCIHLVLQSWKVLSFLTWLRRIGQIKSGEWHLQPERASRWEIYFAAAWCRQCGDCHMLWGMTEIHTWICLKAFHFVSLCIHFAQCRLVIACPGLRVGHHLATLVPLAITSVIPFRFHGLDSSTPWLRCCWRPWEVTLRWPRPSGLLFVVYQCLSVKFNVWLYRYYMILSCE